MADVGMIISDPDLELPRQPNAFMQEVHISLQEVVRKSLLLLNPLTIAAPANKLDDLINKPDLTTPLVFFLALILCLMIHGNLHSVGLLYELAISGCVAVYTVIQTQARPDVGVPLLAVVSSLGHCLLPLVALTFATMVVEAEYPSTIVITVIATVWCTLAATKLLRAQAKVMGSVAFIVYPCTVIYALVAIITLF